MSIADTHQYQQQGRRCTEIHGVGCQCPKLPRRTEMQASLRGTSVLRRGGHANFADRSYLPGHIDWLA